VSSPGVSSPGGKSSRAAQPKGPSSDDDPIFASFGLSLDGAGELGTADMVDTGLESIASALFGGAKAAAADPLQPLPLQPPLMQPPHCVTGATEGLRSCSQGELGRGAGNGHHRLGESGGVDGNAELTSQLYMPEGLLGSGMGL